LCVICFMAWLLPLLLLGYICYVHEIQGSDKRRHCQRGGKDTRPPVFPPGVYGY